MSHAFEQSAELAVDRLSKLLLKHDIPSCNKQAKGGMLHMSLVAVRREIP